MSWRRVRGGAETQTTALSLTDEREKTRVSSQANRLLQPGNDRKNKNLSVCYAEDQDSRMKQVLLVFRKKAIASRHYNPKVAKVE
jgi:hypothetical protein